MYANRGCSIFPRAMYYDILPRSGKRRTEAPSIELVAPKKAFPQFCGPRGKNGSRAPPNVAGEGYFWPMKSRGDIGSRCLQEAKSKLVANGLLPLSHSCSSAFIMLAEL